MRDFPPDEKAIITTITWSYSGEKRPIPHKTLIINTSGLFRLIQNSRKPEAKLVKERFIEILADIAKKGFNRASRPKIWIYPGKEYTHTEWLNKKSENYLRLHPDKDFDDFLKTLLF